ncbi:unnamed protein product [Taenia asiatica]|uniref:CS domain-containing protein n=1 Tax=Taenia asiatica TaxID=60517 RepID=A0A0R3WCB9_TAEAS|nr:unnamed protein product [Taenia asiatica]
MITVAVEDGEPVRVVLLIPGLTVPYKFFGGGTIKGKFQQSGSGDASSFISTLSLSSADLVISLSDWSLDVECRLKNGDQDLKYKCRQFPGQIVPGEARYETKVMRGAELKIVSNAQLRAAWEEPPFTLKVHKGKIILKLPKADPSQSWAGELAANGLDQSLPS